ncbi:MAG: hypothetical protein RIR53_281 [Bacteroidota bacterium]|jgi:hypothetical protein
MKRVLIALATLACIGSSVMAQTYRPLTGTRMILNSAYPTGGSLTLQANPGASYTLTMPSSAPTANYILANGAVAGTMEWKAPLDIYQFTNGLTETGTNTVELGGTLTKNTVVDAASNTLTLQATTGQVLVNADFEVTASNGSIDLTAPQGGVSIQGFTNATIGADGGPENSLMYFDPTNVEIRLEDLGATKGSMAMNYIPGTGTSYQLTFDAVDISTLGTNTTTIGNATTTFSLASTGLNISSAGVISDAGGDVVILGNVISSAHDTYNLGSNAVRWRDIFIGPSSLHIGTAYGASELLIGYSAGTGTAYFNIDASTNALTIDAGDGITAALSLTTNAALTANGNVTLGSDASDQIAINGVISSTSVVFEGSTADANELTLIITNPTADRTITFPNSDGIVTLASTDGSMSVSKDLTVGEDLLVIGTTTLQGATSIGDGDASDLLTINTQNGAANLVLQEDEIRRNGGSLTLIGTNVGATESSSLLLDADATLSNSSGGDVVLKTVNAGNGGKVSIEADGSVQLTDTDVGGANSFLTLDAGSDATFRLFDGTAWTGQIAIYPSSKVVEITSDNGVGVVTFNADATTGTASLSATSAVNINTGTSTGAVSIANGTGAQTIGIGNGAAVKTVTLGSTTGASTTTIQSGTGNLALTASSTGAIIASTGGSERMRITSAGRVGIGVGASSPAGMFQVFGGEIIPSVGSSATSGITWPDNPGGGGSDDAWIRYYAESGENTKLQFGTSNDADDDIEFVQSGVRVLSIATANVGIGQDADATNKLAVSGGAVSLNNSSNFAVNIGTGTSTGAITVGGSAAQTIDIGTGAAAKTVSLGSTNTTSTTSINSGSGGVRINNNNNQPTNINTGTSTGAVSIGNTGTSIAMLGTTTINTTGSGNTTIGNASTSGTTTIATNSTTGRLVISGLPTGTTDDVLLINGSNQVSRITQVNLLAGSAWTLLGNSGTSAATNFIGTTDAQPLVFRTDNVERMRISETGLLSAVKGADIYGGTIWLNANHNFETNINTGTSTGGVTIGGSAAQTIDIGTGAAAKTVNIGSTNTTSTTSLNSGSGGVKVNVDNNQPTNINTGTSTGAVTIGGSAAQTIDIAAGTGNKTLGLGSTDGASTTSLNSGSGGVKVNVDNNQPTNINTGTSTGGVTIGGSAAQTIDIGTGAAAKTVSIGSTNSTSTTSLNSGSGGVKVNVDNNQPTNINTGTSTGPVNIGTGSASGAVSIGRSDGTTTITGTTSINADVNNATNINTGTSTAGVTIGGSAAQTINIATGTGNKTLGLGSTDGTSTSSLNSGSGGVKVNVDNNQPTNINTGTSTGKVTVGNSGSEVAVEGKLLTTVKVTNADLDMLAAGNEHYNVVVFQDDGGNAARLLTLPAGTEGRIIVVINEDAAEVITVNIDNIPTAIANGRTVAILSSQTFVYSGGAWH